MRLTLGLLLVLVGCATPPTVRGTPWQLQGGAVDVDFEQPPAQQAEQLRQRALIVPRGPRFNEMAEDMKELLLDDRWAPVTSELGFLEARAEYAARAFASWHAGLQASRGIAIQVRPVSGTLEQVLPALLPLTDAERQRHLFLPTRGCWTAYLDTGWRGTDAGSPMPGSPSLSSSWSSTSRAG
jgi:hypothetical protein